MQPSRIDGAKATVRSSSAVVVSLMVFLSGCVPAGTKQPAWAPPPSSASGGDDGPQSSAYRLGQTFPMCATQGHARPQAAALGAILLALPDSEWTLLDVETDRARVTAKACLRNNPANCVMKELFADASGRLSIRSPSGVRDRADLEDDVRRWLTILERNYNRYCAYSDEALDAELAKYGK